VFVEFHEAEIEGEFAENQLLEEATVQNQLQLLEVESTCSA
jgi:hypothetical protein